MLANIRILLFTLLVLVILALIGCDSKGPDSVGTGSPIPAVSIVTSLSSSESTSPIASTTHTSVQAAASPSSLPFVENEPDHEGKHLADRIRGYEKKLAEAVNSQSFPIVAPYLLPGSLLERSQKALVDNLASRGIKERFVSSEIYGFTKENNVYKVDVTEDVEVTFPGKAPKIQEYKWIYTVELREGTMFLSQLEEWSNNDFERRSGAVKADGYYVGEFPEHFPVLLETAVNTLDLTDLRMVTSDSAVMARLKVLITELRAAGKDYSFKGKTVAENWNTYTWVLELTYTFSDSQGGKHSGTRKLFLQLDEIRSGFFGHAIIRYLEDASQTPLLSEPEVEVYRFVEVEEGKPEVLLEVHGMQDEPSHSSSFQADRIKVYQTGLNGEKGKLMQELRLKSPTRTFIGQSLGLVVEDMNFDGIPDVRIQSDTPPGPNTPYFYWLWDVRAASFVENIDLEDITSPIFQTDDKTIFSSNRGSAASHTESTYRYMNGTPKIIKEIQYDFNTIKKVWHITLREIVNGTLRVAGEYEEE